MILRMVKKIYIVSNDKTFAKALKKEILKFTQEVYCFTGDVPDTEKKANLYEFK